MPTRSTTDFARPKDDDEFENLVRDICAELWADPGTQRVSRTGKPQYGVDVYGQPSGMNGEYYGAQCKLHAGATRLTEAEARDEVTKAEKFPHKLARLVVATTSPRDLDTQTAIDKLSAEHEAAGGFPVEPWFWQDICERLASYPRLVLKYYRDYFSAVTNSELAERLIDFPLCVLTWCPAPGEYCAGMERQLRQRGLRVEAGNGRYKAQYGAAELLADGYLFCADALSSANQRSDASLRRLASEVNACVEQLDIACPVFVALPADARGSFLDAFAVLGGNEARITVLLCDRERKCFADDLFDRVYEYGYTRRGRAITVPIALRTMPAAPRGSLLDVDWTGFLGDGRFPSPEVWESEASAALALLTRKLSSLPDSARLQVHSQLPLPAAIAVGFSFNLRRSHVVVRARPGGGSHYHLQFWSSDATPAPIDFEVVERKCAADACRTAIMELTTYVDIQSSISDFVQAERIVADEWVCLRPSANITTAQIDEKYAVAYANQVGRLARHLTSRGVTDIHLFARMPSALAVLVGQRLLACGRIHLYWFDNPGYRFAFTLK